MRLKFSSKKIRFWGYIKYQAKNRSYRKDRIHNTHKNGQLNKQGKTNTVPKMDDAESNGYSRLFL